VRYKFHVVTTSLASGRSVGAGGVSSGAGLDFPTKPRKADQYVSGSQSHVHHHSLL